MVRKVTRNSLADLKVALSISGYEKVNARSTLPPSWRKGRWPWCAERDDDHNQLPTDISGLNLR